MLRTIIRDINRILCYIPLIWVISFFSIAFISMIILGKMPSYKTMPSPYDLSIAWIGSLMFNSMMLSFLSVPLNLLLTLFLLLNKVKFTKHDKIGLVIMVLCVATYFICSFFMSGIFEWILD